MSRRGRYPALVAALALATALSPARAQSPAEPEEVFFDHLDLTVVNVEVYVTDKDGKPVRGLGPEDFALSEDGGPVAISNFYAVEAGKARLAAGIEPLETAADAAATALPRVENAIPGEQRLSLVVYVDNLFVRPFNRNRVLRQARGFLRRVMRGGDRAMVVSFDRALHVRQPFTVDSTLVEAALLDLEEVTGYGVQAETERADVIRRLDNVSSSFEAEGHVESYAVARFFEVRQTIDALEDMIELLAGLPGRKAIVYVSDGFPMTAGDDLYYLLDQRYPDQTGGELAAARHRARRLVRDMTYKANANRVTFYTLQAKGLRSQSSLSAASRSTGGSMIEIDSVYDSSHEAPLEMMARDTGGLAALGTNNIDGALERVAEDFENYYSLGYVASHVTAGRYHRIEVEVKRKGVSVRHRDGYRDKPLETRFSEATLASLRYGGGANDLGIELRAGDPKQEEANKGRYLVPIEVRIPIGKLTLLPRAAEHLGKMQVSVAVRGDDGEVSPVSITPLDLTIPETDLEAARKQYYIFAVELLMRPGIHRVVIGVRDDVAGEEAFTDGAVEVGT